MRLWQAGRLASVERRDGGKVLQRVSGVISNRQPKYPFKWQQVSDCDPGTLITKCRDDAKQTVLAMTGRICVVVLIAVGLFGVSAAPETVGVF